MTDLSRKFLAVSDETEECISAMLFAGMRAKAVGAGVLKPTIRVTFWGAFAMGLTAAIGAIFGKVVWS